MALIFQRMVKQSFDLQHLCGPQEGVEPLLLDLNLSLVHEVEEQAEIFLSHVPQDDNRVGARVALRKGKLF